MTRPAGGRLVAAAVAAVVVVAFVVVLAGRIGVDPSFRATALLGKPVPDVTVEQLDGETVDLASFTGRAVVVNFWNTWCVPCRREVPALEQFWARHGDDDDVVLLGIVRDDSESAVRSFVEERRWDWTIAFDPGDQAALDFGTTGQPETFAIAPDGTVVGRRVGEATVDDLERLLAMARGAA